MRTSEATRDRRREGAGSAPGELTARNLAAMLRAAGLPCVTLTTEPGAATQPASIAEEGLRIVAGGLSVRVLYAIPPGRHGAGCRRDSHLMWLADFAEEHRWSAKWLAEGWMTVRPSRGPLPTYATAVKSSGPPAAASTRTSVAGPCCGSCTTPKRGPARSMPRSPARSTVPEKPPLRHVHATAAA